MGLSGEAVSIVKLVTDAIAIGCCALRWYILRDKQSKGTLLSHYLFTFCITCEVAATVISSIVLLSGDAYIDEHGLSAGQKYLLDEWVLMVYPLRSAKGSSADEDLDDFLGTSFVLPGRVCIEGGVSGVLYGFVLPGADEEENGDLDCRGGLGCELSLRVWRAVLLLRAFRTKLVSPLRR